MLKKIRMFFKTNKINISSNLNDKNNELKDESKSIAKSLASLQILSSRSSFGNYINS